MKKKKIFISHIALDEVLALELKRWIETAFRGQCEVFVAGSFQDIRPGEQWIRKVRQSLVSCDLLLVICSRKSINSRWVLFETGAIWGREVTILPICCDSAVDLPVPFAENQLLNFSDPDFSKKLIESLAAALGLPDKSPAWVNKMTMGLQKAYRRAKLDGDIIDRIRHAREKKGLSRKDCTAASLAAHFRESLNVMKKNLNALNMKGYLRPVHNVMIGDYYLLTPKTERLLR